MNDCRTFRDLIDQYLDGTIDDGRLRELEAHAQTCPACADELRRSRLMGEAIENAFAPATGLANAKDRLLASLSNPPRPGVVTPMAWRWMAVAAGVLLAVGLLLGLILGRMSTVQRDTSLAAEVPIRVTHLAGTVLVRHDGTNVWHELASNSAVRVGDTFHAVGKAGFTLELGPRSAIDVDQNSMLVLKSFNGKTQFFLEHGHCRASLESPHGPFFISTPNGRVEALGTEFTVTVE